MATSFEEFFEGPFEQAMQSVKDEHVPTTGQAGVSWDRKAAYLLWKALGQPGVKTPEEDWDLI